ncbi:MAG: tRNA uridine-5-carboxymethylaminomethyl(34) synthesis GTPase MnmE [Pseudomonas fluorescens]|nr:MAG: tRNA uridine-5-carboxymethylaminomethyl(34) synthesis GTPase MnmE [Pseudomonas fluorescens]
MNESLTASFSYPAGDTIVALATAPVASGVAVIRLSGPRAWEVGTSVCAALEGASPRKAVFGKFRLGREELDEGLALGFRAPASFTGEDVVELQGHGGRAVVQAVLDAVLAHGVRMALPGEFSRRAVMNGKMDLTAAEGLADLIAAQTDVQRRQALRQLDGALGERFEGWRTAVMHLLAQVEAAIDFPDEELDVLSAPGLTKGVHTLMGDLQNALGEQAGARVRDGIALAIVGKPNAGKSTLLNLLAGRDVAIVSDIAGTTRDVVTSMLDIGGFPVTVADTAGMRATQDVIEAEGVRRAKKQAERADVLVVVVDSSEGEELDAEMRGLLLPGRTLVVMSKADKVDLDFPAQITIGGAGYPVVAANLTDAAGLRRVMPALSRIVAEVGGEASESALLTRQRHKAAVEQAMQALGNGLRGMSKAGGEGSVAELVAQDLRDAAAAIGSVTGRTGSEDVLDVVFSTFCIGK